MRRRLLYLQLVVVSLIAVLDIHFGLDRMYFWTLWWFDIPLHILGGAWAGLCTAWLAAHLGYRPTLAICLGGAFLIGGSWEIFEYIFHIGGSAFMSYPLDTAKDMADDVIGGAIAYALARAVRV